MYPHIQSFHASALVCKGDQGLEGLTASRRSFSTLSVVALVGSVGAIPASGYAAADASALTKRVLDRHLGAFAKGIDAIMADYAKDSVILTRDKIYRGQAEIRTFFGAFLKGVKPGFWEAFKISAQSVDREVAYLVWEAKPFVNLATDTLLIRSNKIKVQTFTAT